jgi:hypothetical protein
MAIKWREVQQEKAFSEIDTFIGNLIHNIIEAFPLSHWRTLLFLIFILDFLTLYI